MPGEVRRIQSERYQQKERFSSIELDYEPACTILEFWIPSISQTLMITSRLSEKDFSVQALSLKERIQKFTNFTECSTIEDLEPLMPLFKEIKCYYQDIICNPFVDKSLSMLARHFLIELEYCVDLLTGIEYSRLARVQFLNRLNIGNVWLIKNLLVRSHQRCLIKQAYHLMCHAKRWHCESELLAHTIEILCEFYEYYDLLKERMNNNTLNVVIPTGVFADLIDHFVGIAQYSQDVLKGLKK